MSRLAALALLIALGASCSAAAADEPSSDLETVLVRNSSLDGIWKIDAKDPRALVPAVYRVHDVEFANGEGICGLRYGTDGKVNGFKCV